MSIGKKQWNNCNTISSVECTLKIGELEMNWYGFNQGIGLT